MIKIPNCYQKLNTLPDDPPKTEVYAFGTERFQSLAKIFPITLDYAMPLNAEVVIEGIHKCLLDDQGIVECQTGKTKRGSSYIYSIIKNRLEPFGVQYFLRMDIFKTKSIVEINAFTEEIGATGIREATIFSALKIENQSDFYFDPYDKEYKKGFLMNLSEKEEYDSLFMDHPLSEIRCLKDFIIINN